MYVRMYVCMYVCMFIYMYVLMYVCIYVYMYVCTQVAIAQYNPRFDDNFTPEFNMDPDRERAEVHAALLQTCRALFRLFCGNIGLFIAWQLDARIQHASRSWVRWGVRRSSADICGSFAALLWMYELFCGNTGLFCMTILRQNSIWIPIKSAPRCVPLFCGYIGFFCGYMGLFYGSFADI